MLHIHVEKGEGCRNTKTISKQGITKVNVNNTSSSSALGFDCYQHKDNCYIFSKDLDLCRL